MMIQIQFLYSCSMFFVNKLKLTILNSIISNISFAIVRENYVKCRVIVDILSFLWSKMICA